MKVCSGIKLTSTLLGLCAAVGLTTAALAAPLSISPASITLAAGDTFTLSVVGDTPVTNRVVAYQWVKDGTVLVDDDRISGSQSSSLTVSNSVVDDSGTYVASLTYYSGLVQTNLSASVTVIALSYPQIQSIDSLAFGDDVAFRVTATGGLLSYQWFWQGQPLAAATNSMLVLSNAYLTANAGYYTVAVSNALGTTFSPQPGTLFTKPTPSGTYQGIYFDTNAVSPDSSGFIQFSLSAKNQKFTGKIRSGLNTWKFSGSFTVAHEAEVHVDRLDDSQLVMQLQLLTLNDTPAIQGTVTDGNWTACLRAVQLPYSAKSPAPQAGRYTLALHTTNYSAAAPTGDGWATMKVSPAGTVSLTGQAADGVRLSQAPGISKLGEWPLYVPLYQGEGVLLGWLRFTNQASGNLRGSTVYWVKPATSDVFYPDGFALSLTPLGSSYVAPATSTNSVLNFQAGVAAFSGGDLLSQGAGVWSFVSVSLRPPNKFKAESGVEDLKLSESKSTGAVSGRFVDYATDLVSQIRGVVLQQQNIASGFFLSTNTAGAFQLVPK